MSLKELFNKYRQEIQTEEKMAIDLVRKKEEEEKIKIFETNQEINHLIEPYLEIASKIGIFEAFSGCVKEVKFLNKDVSKVTDEKPNSNISCSLLFEAHDNDFRKNTEIKLNKIPVNNNKWEENFTLRDIADKKYVNLKIKSFSLKFNWYVPEYEESSYGYGEGSSWGWHWNYSKIECLFFNSIDNLFLKINGNSTNLEKNEAMKKIIKLFIINNDNIEKNNRENEGKI